MITASVVCNTTIVVNTIENNNQLTEADMSAYETALYRCGQIYGESTCVKRFEIKRDPWGQRAYRITCIAPDKEITIPLRGLR